MMVKLRPTSRKLVNAWSGRRRRTELREGRKGEEEQGWVNNGQQSNTTLHKQTKQTSSPQPRPTAHTISLILQPSPVGLPCCLFTATSTSTSCVVGVGDYETVKSQAFRMAGKVHAQISQGHALNSANSISLAAPF